MNATPAPFDRSVTAIIATYNRADYIEQSIDSILGQREEVAQLIVVDDGSTDGTASKLEKYGRRIEYVRKENGGKSSAVNLGLRSARGAWIWLFDDDDVAMPDATATLLAALESNPGSDVAFGGAVKVTTAADGALVPLRRVDPLVSAGEDLFLNVLLGFSFCLPAMLMRRTSLEAIGGLDERFLRGQDYELIVRLLRHCRATEVRRPVFFWRQHDGVRGPAKLRHSASERDRHWNSFEALVGREIRGGLSLGEYLVPKVVEHSLSARQASEALFNRAAVMATRGLLREFAEDLSVSLSLRSADERLSPAQRDLMFRIGGNDRFLACLADTRISTLSKLAALPRNRGAREVFGCLARAMFYEYRRRSTERGQSGRLFSCVVRLAVLAGPRALMAAYRVPRASAGDTSRA